MARRDRRAGARRRGPAGAALARRPARAGRAREQAAAPRPLIVQAIVERPAGLSDARFETASSSSGDGPRPRRARWARPRRVRDRLGLEPDRRLQGPRRRRPAGRRLSRPRRRPRRSPCALPPALRHEHPPDLAARPAVPAARPQRRDQHGPRQPGAGPRPDGRPLGAPGSAGPGSSRPGRPAQPDGSDSLSLDEALELLVATGWPIATALLALVREAPGLRRHGPRSNQVIAAFGADGRLPRPLGRPGAFAFTDGRTVGALVDRNGLRPLAYAVTADGIVAAASEAGAVPLERGRDRPPRPARARARCCSSIRAAGAILEDAEAKAAALGALAAARAPAASPSRPPGRRTGRRRGRSGARPTAAVPMATPPALRYLAGLDAERLRQDIRTMAVEGHEPLWSMGDDTPTPAQARVDRPVADHLRQAFAQVTNPPIDPERERAVMDLSIELGRRPPLLGGPPAAGGPGPSRLDRPIVADPDGLIAGLPGRRPPPRRHVGPADRARRPARALDRLAAAAPWRPRGPVTVLIVLDDRRRLARPAADPVASSPPARSTPRSTEAGRRGRTDLLVVASDILDIHGLAMALAVGRDRRRAVARPRAGRRAGRRPPGDRGPDARGRRPEPRRPALEAGLRKVLARMGISTIASYVGSALFETVELAPDVVAPLLPGRPGWPGRSGLAELADRALRRLATARRSADSGAAARLPDPGLRPLPGRRRAPPLRPADRPRRPGARRRDRPTARRAARRAALGAVPARPRPPAGDGPRRPPAAPASARRSRSPRSNRRRGDRPPLRRGRDEPRRALARGARGGDARASSAPAAPPTPARAARIRPVPPAAAASAATPGSSRSPRPGSG